MRAAYAKIKRSSDYPDIRGTVSFIPAQNGTIVAAEVYGVTDGYAWLQVYTGRFQPEDIIGKTVVLHGMPDDFHTQPSGDSGMKIACGEILPV